MVSRRKREGEITVFLGGDSLLEGSMTFKGKARLDGAFKGEINGTGTLLVGPEARVEADIEADSVIISGQVVGDVVGRKRIELHAPGKLTGNISAPLVVMDEGVLFEGNCRMADKGVDERGNKIRLISDGVQAAS